MQKRLRWVDMSFCITDTYAPHPFIDSFINGNDERGRDRGEVS
jgi:hypothetical protein